MKKFLIFSLALLAVSSSIVSGETVTKERLMLPKPSLVGNVSVEEAIKRRRTVRDFEPTPPTLAQLSQLLWAAQGITDEKRNLRSAPSGGALYPLDVYVISGEGGADGLSQGVYRYLPREHALQKITDVDKRNVVAQAALEQSWIAKAPVIFVITAEYRRITVKYGKRGVRYALIEAGPVGQNIFLQAESLGLGAGIVGAFDDGNLARAIEAPDEHEPLLVMPVGFKR